jgi:hypothetical protein
MPQIRPIGVSGSIPSVNQLALGDIALNTYDGKAYIKKLAGNTQTIVELGTGTGGNSISASYAATASYAEYAVTASFALNFNPFATASYALQSLSSSYAATASSADRFIIRTALTASGLNYPSTDNGEFSFIQTDGNGNLSLQYVNTLYETIYNGEATTLVKGTPVYVSGSVGANSIVYRADAGNSSKMPVIYISADNIASGTTGRGIVLGLITGVNTTGYPGGTEIYVAVGGGWTATRPTGSAIVQILGIVTKEGSGGQGVVLNPGPANLPNLISGSIWVGNSSSVPVAIPTSSLSVASASYAVSSSQAISASYATTSSHAVNTISASFASTASYINPLTQNVSITGNLIVRGTASVDVLITTYESSSIIYSSGSTKFGDSLDDFHQFTGSLLVTGSSHSIIGQTTINNLTGSLFGTASWAQNALVANTSSFAFSSSLVYINDRSTTDINYPLIFKGDSFSLDDYRSLGADTAGPYYNPLRNTLGSVAGLIISASSFSGPLTGSLLGTASYAENAKIFPFTGSAIISGSLTVQGNVTVNSATTIDLNTSVLNINAPTIQVPSFGLPYSPSPAVRTVMYDAVSNILFVTASIPGTTLSFITTGSITALVDVGPAALKPYFFLVQSGSVDMLSINANRTLTLETRYDTPPATTGSIFYSASGEFFLGTL